MDFKKAFISVSVAFFTVIIDILFNTMYVFPIAVIILLSYYLMKYFEEAKELKKECETKEEVSLDDIPYCNVNFFKSILKKKIRDFENNRFLVNFLNKKVKELKNKVVDYVEISLENLSKHYNLTEALSGKIFAKKGFFEDRLKEFFDYLDKEGIKYSYKIEFEKDFFCKGVMPVLIEVNFPDLNLSERQIEIILVGEKYKGKIKIVEKLFELRTVVENAGGFFAVIKEDGIKVFFGFAGSID
ncbi:hypothetical protein TTHT_1977 [Thermotomaculum hydrothermale]|uniref:Uncharacterized protein n=1 Tax=Thermotomaculum hydrothermale TaxID=981385 RepID=A0A7R6T050_9BACT|nr:hypothetical protein [Thermotomaculum hydrothermale]BBB33420.1 hypothetical protein TTHT_1977 [Thermotomaculum hydrothermale]